MHKICNQTYGGRFDLWELQDAQAPDLHQTSRCAGGLGPDRAVALRQQNLVVGNQAGLMGQEFGDW